MPRLHLPPVWATVQNQRAVEVAIATWGTQSTPSPISMNVAAYGMNLKLRTYVGAVEILAISQLNVLLNFPQHIKDKILGQHGNTAASD